MICRNQADGSQNRLLANESGSQLVEFAVALPLLVLFVVGIFDFSNAFTLKQRLTNIARDAARASAADPSSDLQGAASGTPISVIDVYYVVDNYLVANNLNDCGITSTATASGTLTWKFSGNGNGCPSPGLSIIVNRGYVYPATGGATPSSTCISQNAAGQVAVLSTCVSIQYAYPWRFGRAASLLGRTTVLPTQITGVAVAFNED
ncbi:MAG TPA: TadE family protein [Candidatus Sulfotelmatobacter sp.]|nr:TadE family protein [Candidatus Sulfotelmatobacter sp.]